VLNRRGACLKLGEQSTEGTTPPRQWKRGKKGFYLGKEKTRKRTPEKGDDIGDAHEELQKKQKKEIKGERESRSNGNISSGRGEYLGSTKNKNSALRERILSDTGYVGKKKTSG